MKSGLLTGWRSGASYVKLTLWSLILAMVFS
jgi:hypothetical protein